MLTARDLMERLGCSRATAYRMVARALAPMVTGEPGATLATVERPNARGAKRRVRAVVFAAAEVG